MSEGKSGYTHSDSDRKLDHAADAANAASKAADEKHGTGPGHDAAKIARHDDAGKDRLFEKREQHDEGERKSEKSRLAKDAARHEHPTDHSANDTSNDVPADA